MPATFQKHSEKPVSEVHRLLEIARRHLQQNEMLAAAKSFFAVIELQPDCFEAFAQLGSILNQLNQVAEACVCLQTALRLNPDFPQLNLLLGGVLKKMRRFDEAAACCRREIQIQPGSADAHYNLGLVLQNLEQLESSAAAYEKTLALRPGYLDALINLGCVRRQQLQADAALESFEEAVRREPKNPEAHWELAATLLWMGKFERGWQQYEWRWRQKDFKSPAFSFAQPRWDGSELCGRRIFLHTEQGCGDIIQFARYATLVARRGGEVIIGCPPALRTVIETISGVQAVITNPAALANFDFHAPLMSLPGIFETTLQNIPAQIPYITPPKNYFEPLKISRRQLNVGIVWAGDSAHRNDRNRSMSLKLFLPLLQSENVRWFSLQAGQRRQDLEALKADVDITDVGGRVRDFGDTAQAIAQLDLVITVDTSVAHLAGALGKPVWILLPYESEWRWMMDRKDSPWYPSARLFRQTSPGNWPDVLEQLFDELKILRNV